LTLVRSRLRPWCHFNLQQSPVFLLLVSSLPPQVVLQSAQPNAPLLTKLPLLLPALPITRDYLCYLWHGFAGPVLFSLARFPFPVSFQLPLPLFQDAVNQTRTEKNRSRRACEGGGKKQKPSFARLTPSFEGHTSPWYEIVDPQERSMACHTKPPSLRGGEVWSEKSLPQERYA
jgi:hypothetical protein